MTGDELPWGPVLYRDMLALFAQAGFSAQEKGVWIDLRGRQWLEGALPAELRALGKMLGLPVSAIRRVVDRCYPLTADGTARQDPDLEASRAESMWRHLKRSNAGKRRWGKTPEAPDLPAPPTAGVRARERRNERLRRERMKEAQARGTHTQAEWLALVEEVASTCVRCLVPGYVEPDHIVPVNDGGSDAIDNIQPLCPRCNASKGTETINWLAGWRESNAHELGSSNARQHSSKRGLSKQKQSTASAPEKISAASPGRDRPAPRPTPAPDETVPLYQTLGLTEAEAEQRREQLARDLRAFAEQPLPDPPPAAAPDPDAPRVALVPSPRRQVG